MPTIDDAKLSDAKKHQKKKRKVENGNGVETEFGPQLGNDPATGVSGSSVHKIDSISLQLSTTAAVPVSLSDSGQGLGSLSRAGELARRILGELESSSKDTVIDGIARFRKALIGRTGADLAVEDGSLIEEFVRATPDWEVIWKVWEEFHSANNVKGCLALMLLIADLVAHPAGCVTNGPPNSSSRWLSSRLDSLSRSLIQKRLRPLYSHLSSPQRNRINTALLLLTCVILRGSSLTRDLTATFDFSLSALAKLALHPRQKGGEAKGDGGGGGKGGVSPSQSRLEALVGLNEGGGGDPVKLPTRLLYIGFGLGLLGGGDTAVVRSVLQKKSLFSGIMQGLAADPPPVIARVLHSVRVKVMGANCGVPRGLQGAFFGDGALEQLARISAFSLHQSPAATSAAQLAHQILLAICTHPSHGLAPLSPPLPPSLLDKDTQPGLGSGAGEGEEGGGKGGGHGRLLRLLLRLKPTEVRVHVEVLLAAAGARPGVGGAYLAALPYSLEPRVSDRWFLAMTIVSELVKISTRTPFLPPVRSLTQPPPSQDSPVWRAAYKKFCLPAMPKAALSRGIQHRSPLVKYFTLKFLLASLDGLGGLLAEIKEAEIFTAETGGKGGAEDTWEERSASERIVAECRATETNGAEVSKADPNVAEKGDYRFEDLDVVGARYLQGVVTKAGGGGRVSGMWSQAAEAVQESVRGFLADPNTVVALEKALEKAGVVGGNERDRGEKVAGKGGVKRRFVVGESRRGGVKKQRGEGGEKAEVEVGEEFVEGGVVEGEGQGVGVEEEGKEGGKERSEASGGGGVDGEEEEEGSLWDVMEDEEGGGERAVGVLLHALVMEALAKFRILLPQALAECHLDPFRLLPIDPSSLPPPNQRALLSFLTSFAIPSPRQANGGGGSIFTFPGGAYLHATPLLRLYVGAASEDIRRAARRVVEGAMANAGGFDLDLGEVGVWVDALPQREKGGGEGGEGGEAGTTLGVLVEASVKFLGDAVAAVGRNPKKFLDVIGKKTSEMAGRVGKGGGGEVSPLLVCALQHSCRVASSASTTLTLPQKSAVSLFVGGAVNALFRTKRSSSLLAAVVTAVLGPHLPPGGEGYLCEWAPLQALLRDAEGGWDGGGMEKGGMEGGLLSVLGEAGEAVRRGEEGVGEAVTSAVVCSPPGHLEGRLGEVVQLWWEGVGGMGGEGLLAVCRAYPGMVVSGAGDVAGAWEVVSRLPLWMLLELTWRGGGGRPTLFGLIGEKVGAARGVDKVTAVRQVLFMLGRLIASWCGEDGLLAGADVDAADVAAWAKSVYGVIQRAVGMGNEEAPGGSAAEGEGDVGVEIVREAVRHPAIGQLVMDCLKRDWGCQVSMPRQHARLQLQAELARCAMQLLKAVMGGKEVNGDLPHQHLIGEACEPFVEASVEALLDEVASCDRSGNWECRVGLAAELACHSRPETLSQLVVALLPHGSSSLDVETGEFGRVRSAVGLRLASALFRNSGRATSAMPGGALGAYLGVAAAAVRLSSDAAYESLLLGLDASCQVVTGGRGAGGLADTWREVERGPNLAAFTPLEVLCQLVGPTSATESATSAVGGAIAAHLVRAGPAYRETFGRTMERQLADPERVADAEAKGTFDYILPAVDAYLAYGPGIHVETSGKVAVYFRSYCLARLQTAGGGGEMEGRCVSIVKLSVGGWGPWAVREVVPKQGWQWGELTGGRVCALVQVAQAVVGGHKNRIRFLVSLMRTLGAVYQHSKHGDVDADVAAAEGMEAMLLHSLTECAEAVRGSKGRPGVKFLQPLKAFAYATLRNRFQSGPSLRALCLLADLATPIPGEEEGVGEEAEAVRQLGAEVAELLLSHSLFIATLVAPPSANGKLPPALGRNAGKEEGGGSLASIYSLLENPVVPYEGYEAEGESDIATVRKQEVVNLLGTFLRMRLCQVAEGGTSLDDILSLLLAAYGATLSPVDKSILKLMREIEAWGGEDFPGLITRDFLWGEGALKRRREEGGAGAGTGIGVSEEEMSEGRRRRFREDLGVDPRRCGLTVLFFPRERGLGGRGQPPEEGRRGEEGEVVDKAWYRGGRSLEQERWLEWAGHDPSFLLPLCTHALKQGLMELREFARVGFVSTALAALSSGQEGVRESGYRILGKYEEELQRQAGFKERTQLLLLLRYVRNSVTEPFQRLPAVSVCFAAEAACVLMHPESIHYKVINKALLYRPALNLEEAPLFYNMFNSASSSTFRAERTWMLRQLAAGLTRHVEAQIYRRRFIAELLMSFWGTALADAYSRKLILQVIRRGVQLERCALDWANRVGLVPWLTSAVVTAGTMVREGEGGGKEAKGMLDVGAMAVEVLELLLTWQRLQRWFLRDGFSHLVHMACQLYHVSADSATLPDYRARILRPTLRLLATAVAISGRRHPGTATFSFSFHHLWTLWKNSGQLSAAATPHTLLQPLLLLLANGYPRQGAAVEERAREALSFIHLAQWAIAASLRLPLPPHTTDMGSGEGAAVRVVLWLAEGLAGPWGVDMWQSEKGAEWHLGVARGLLRLQGQVAPSARKQMGAPLVRALVALRPGLEEQVARVGKLPVAGGVLVRYVDSWQAGGGGMEGMGSGALGVRTKGKTVELGEILEAVLPILLRHLAESEEGDGRRRRDGEASLSEEAKVEEEEEEEEEGETMNGVEEEKGEAEEGEEGEKEEAVVGMEECDGGGMWVESFREGSFREGFITLLGEMWEGVVPTNFLHMLHSWVVVEDERGGGMEDGVLRRVGLEIWEALLEVGVMEFAEEKKGTEKGGGKKKKKKKEDG